MTISKAAERALIRKAKQGDGCAMEELIRTHQKALYAFMLRMIGKPEVAEDVVQEAFVRVLRNLDRFDDRFRFSTWLFTIAKRLYMNQLQKHAPAYESEVVEGWQGSHGKAGSFVERTEAIENARSIIDFALYELSEQQREIVLLFHQQNWPIADIAAHLGMPEGTIKSHLHRARKRMRRTIEEDDARHLQVKEVWT